ncbi:hypothetical protein L1049_023403 [Liquidambar formosana]|uniref:Aminotransferase-like plant mobile domain-containing protein n=1 Tax=Liquidambar formosana TaxID=63359 RepID=A0AAP0RUD4_LIQFO
MMDMYAGLPGPIDGSVLYRQDRHRSDRIWSSQDQSILTYTLTTRRSDSGLWGRAVDPLVMRHLHAAGFYGLSRIGFIRLDPALITALVERWRQETHTFHLPIGEVTITLQDVAVLWGLPIDGLPVTSMDSYRTMAEWQELCQNLLGRRPLDIDISGGSLRIGWITEYFTELPDDPPADLVVQFARARMLHLIGGIMLPDKTQNKVQLMFLPFLEHLDQIHTYSWGSACLARLYRDLCRASSAEAKDIGGASVLLQLWAWERLPRLAPHLPPGVVADGFEPIMIDPQESLPPGPHGCKWGVEHSLKNTPNHMVVAFRDQLDQLRADEFIWQPYSDDLIGRLPEYCRQGMELWRTRDMQRIRHLSLQTLQTIDEVDRLAPIDISVGASPPPCDPPSTSPHSAPSSSCARPTSGGPSTSVPPPVPRWPLDASIPFPGPSSSYAPSPHGLHTFRPPRGPPATDTPAPDLASSFAPSPHFGPSISRPVMFMDDYQTPPHAVMPSSLSSVTPGPPSHFPSFGPPIDATPADIAHHTPPHQPMMSQDISVDEHAVRRGSRRRGRGRARVGDRGRGRAMDHGVHLHPGVDQHEIHDHPELDQQDVDGRPRRVRRRPPCGT